MNDHQPKVDIIIDYVTGLEKPNQGAEANRQAVEHLLVDKLGYQREAIEIDAPIEVNIDGQLYHSTIDIVVRVRGYRYMVIKCAAGSLASRDREAITAARLLDKYQIPLAVATDGITALVWDTVSGKCLGEGLCAIPNAGQANMDLNPDSVVRLEAERHHRQKLIFRAYDTMNVHKG